jgi:cytochrome c oxidase subunit 1
MPRRYHDYLERFTIYHQISSFGSYVMAIGFFMAAYCLLHSLYAGRPAPGNPWGGNSLEWHTPSPPPHDNFKETPQAGDPYDYSDWRWDDAAQGYVRRTA